MPAALAPPSSAVTAPRSVAPPRWGETPSSPLSSGATRAERAPPFYSQVDRRCPLRSRLLRRQSRLHGVSPHQGGVRLRRAHFRAERRERSELHLFTARLTGDARCARASFVGSHGSTECRP